MKTYFRKMATKIPFFVASRMVHIPFAWRLGRAYDDFTRQIDRYDNAPDAEKLNYVIDHLNFIISHAVRNFDFYRKLYRKHGCLDKRIECLDDIEQFPVTSKAMLRDLTRQVKGHLLLNTGGTSGEPFAFYVDKNCLAREWAHMHHIWRLKGYRNTDMKVTLRGRNLGRRNFEYNFINNEFMINIYKDASTLVGEILQIFRKHKIRYIHGYPSAIYGFLRELETILDKSGREIVCRHLRACLMSSEFPLPYITRYLEKVWDLDYISWYGHSEMGVLACDVEKMNQYRPFYTYGYAEVSDGVLLATSYHNVDMPLIRYSTGDLVTPERDKNGLLRHFSVREGREGDFIEDKSGKKISLTGLIFGRHHEIFNAAEFVQIGQDRDGLVTFYITVKQQQVSERNLAKCMDLSNVDIECQFKLLDAPIRTPGGKVNLKVS